MKLNAKASVLLGIGDGPCSVDGRVIATPGGSADWLNDDTVLCQTLVNGAYHVVSLTANGGNLQVLAPHGANELCAGGGRWLGWADGLGLFGSLGANPLAGLRGAGRDGTLVYCPDYQDGRGLVFVNPAGEERTLPNVWVRDLQVIGPGQALWFNGNEIACIGIDLPRPARPAYRMRRVVLPDGEVWLIYWPRDDSGLYAQVDGATDGYILETRPICFHHEAIVVGDEVIVAWSVTEGEGPGDLRKVVIDRTKSRVSLRPAMSIYFEHSVVISAFKDLNHVTGRPRAEWDLGTFTEDRAYVGKPQERVIFCQDDGAPPMVPLNLRPWDAFALECYPLAHDTPASAAARWHTNALMLLARWPGDCWIVAPFYCQGGAPPNELWTVAEILAFLDRIPEIVNLSPRFKVVACFAYDRANGMTAHPELLARFRQFVAASPGVPTLTPMPAVEPPVAPPVPLPVSELYLRAKEYVMPQTEIGAIKGPGNKFGRVLQADAGKGLFGWYPVLFDRETPDDDCWFELSQPDARHKLRHTKVDGLLGADATEHSTSIPKQFYLKPADDRGILESPVLIHDPASALIVGYFTWPDKGVSGPAFTWVKRS